MSFEEIRLSDLKIDLNSAYGKIGESTPWAAGIYTMSVDAARQGVTRTGKTKIDITFLCKAGPNAGHFYVWDLVLDPNNPRYFLERLQTLGATPEFLESNPSLGEICLQIIGPTNYQVTFSDSKFNGLPTTQISYLERM